MSDADRRGEANPGGWTQERAEAELRSLELFGMRFGLDRMRRMMTALGAPQRRFDAIQVLGTNGKSSTTRMTAAILAHHDLATGAYVSPHLMAYRERILVGGRELEPQIFAAAIARAAKAAEQVNRTLSEDDHVTQFELLTAAGLWAMAEKEVDVAVVEAGLGGRYDATSVIDASVTVLTNVGLEHTRWLGPTVRDIAEEKLAALRPGAILVLGQDMHPDALAVAQRVASERDVRIVRPTALDPGLQLAARGSFQRRNFALAVATAGAYLEQTGRRMDAQQVQIVGAGTEVAGRLQLVAEDPPTLLDGAHNPDAVSALVDSLGELTGERPLALVLGVLEDKDAASMLAALLPRCERAWFTAPRSSRALSPAALQSLARQQGFEDSACETVPELALAHARDFARERGHGTVVLATGSIYLIGDLLSFLAAPSSDGVAKYGQEDLDDQRNTTR